LRTLLVLTRKSKFWSYFLVTLRVFVCTPLLALLLCADVHLRGTITTSQSPQDLTIELRSAAGQATEIATSSPSLTGQFDIPNVKPGHYILAVKNHHGETVKEEHVWANGHSAEVNIRLRDETPERAHAAGEGTVNVQRLNHKVPKAAQKAMGRYRKCRDKRDEACALHALDEAVAADADLLEGYVNRSALHARMQSYDLAIADIDQALRLDPLCALANANRAFVAVHRKEYQQAIVSAKAALRTEPGNVNALYFMALAQVNLGDMDNGFRQLEALADEFPPARATLVEAAPQRARLAAQREKAASLAKSVKIGTNEASRVSPNLPSATGGASAGPGARPATRSAFAEEQRDLGVRRPASSASTLR